MTYVKNIDNCFAFIRTEFEALENKIKTLETVLPKQPPLMKYEPCLNELRKTYSYKDSVIKLFSHGDLEKKYLVANTAITVARENIEEVKKSNLIIIENNKKIQAHIRQMFKMYGIPETVSYVDPKSRARYPKSITKAAGWVDDLTKNVPTTDSYNYTVTSLQAYEKLINDVYKQVKNERVKLEEDRIKIEASIKAEANKTVFLIDMIKKYDLPSDTKADQFLKFLLQKNKYLRLAFWLERNRGDWNEGPTYALHGLDQFSIESNLDQEIYNDICAHIKDWEGDGRVFRDTEWSYGALYAMVNKDSPEMYKDYCQYNELFNLY
jgi:hypothetical protein